MQGDAERDQQDRGLIDRAAGGDREAFGSLVARHRVAVYRLALALTGAPATSEDVLQETFLSAYRHAGSYRGDAPVRAWLLAIARNTARRSMRPKAADPGGEAALFDLGVAAGWGADPEKEAARHETHEHLLVALSALPDDDRDILVLRDLEERSTAEAASALGITVGAAKVRLHRARLRLMARLREGGIDGT